MDKNNFIDKATLELIPKIILIFTSLLITLGVISSVVYYKSFSINIIENITIGEALILFISKFTIFAIPLIFGLLVGVFLYGNINETTEKIKKSKVVKSIKPTIWQELFAFLIILPLFMLSFLGFSPFAIWTIPLAFAVRLFVLSYIIKKAKIYCEFKNIKNNFIQYFQFAGISIIVVAGIAMTQAYLVYGGYTGKKITLHYTNGIVKKTDSLNLYLGKTQSYYYLYDKLNEKATIIKANQIEQIDIELD